MKLIKGVPDFENLDARTVFMEFPGLKVSVDKVKETCGEIAIPEVIKIMNFTNPTCFTYTLAAVTLSSSSDAKHILDRFPPNTNEIKLSVVNQVKKNIPMSSIILEETPFSVNK